jgi:spermidine synthase
MQGLHLTADLYGCACDPTLLTSADNLAALCQHAVAQAQLTQVADKFFSFPPYQDKPGGVTAAVLLAESHLALHTWPEHRSVTLDVYVCNLSSDNSAKAEHLLAALTVAFAPASQNSNRIVRGCAADGQIGELLLEWLNKDSAFGYRASRRLETVRSAYQTIEVFDTPQFGKLFRLDGSYMTSEGDEYFYHEALVHPAALAHTAPRSALIVGGGDGGSAEELLKHPSIERIVLAELDTQVIRIAKLHLRSVHRDVFDNPKLDLKIIDGFAYVRDSHETFDLILLDLTDPESPARRLYSSEFFALLKVRLNPGGALVLHLGSPVFAPAQVQQVLATLASHFARIHPLGLYIPLYGTYWGMAIASDTLNPIAVNGQDIERRLTQRRISDLSYYNGSVHGALFALPNFYRKLLC